MPVAWKGQYWARDGENLVPLALDKLDEIRQQTLNADWTSVLVPEASLTDLDPAAVALAREAFASRRPEIAEDVVNWSMTEFTDRARLTLHGSVTRAALLLLGRPEAAAYLSPHMAQIVWQLTDGEEGYEHFSPPFFLQTSRVFQRIRNVQLKLLRPGSLIPEQIAKYDQRTVLEALHNCLAHQDYALGGRVVVTEHADRLDFTSLGTFYEGRPEDYVVSARVPSRYRNPFLVQAMAALGMIDTMGYGIRMMTARQAQRFLPLPDYDLSEPARVKLTVYGRVVDEAYTHLLMERTDLSPGDVLALDRVQKDLPLDRPTRRRLRQAGLVEGRAPHLHVAASAAAATDSRADYIRTRDQGDTHYANLVLDYLDKFGRAPRRDIDSMLMPLLSGVLSDQQRRNKVSNLLATMRREGRIVCDGPRSRALWRRA